MHIYGKNFLDTSSVDGVGFRAGKMEAAIREYLGEVQKNSAFSEWVQTVIEQMGSLQAAGTAYVGNNAILPDSEFRTSCEQLDPREWAKLQGVVDEINGQLRDWGMGDFQFSTERPPADLPRGIDSIPPFVDEGSRDLVRTSGYADILMNDCKLMGAWGHNGVTALPNVVALDSRHNHLGNFLGFLDLTRLDAGERDLMAHELAHNFGSHPQDVVNLRNVNADIVEGMCESGSQPRSLSVLVYDLSCRRNGYLGRRRTGQSGFGALELASVKSAYVGNGTALQAEVFEESVGRMLQAIRENYGGKVAGFFAAAFCRQFVHSVMNHAIERHVKNTRHQAVLKAVVELMAAVLQVAMLSQNLVGLGLSLGVSHLGRWGLLTQTVKALSNILGTLGLLNVMLALVRGNSYAMIGFVSGIAGHHAGRFAAEMVNTMVTFSLERDKKYLESHRDTSIADNPNVLHEQVHGSILSKLTAIDNMLAKAIEKFGTLNFLYEKIFPVRAQSVEPAVTAPSVTANVPPIPEPTATQAEAGPDADQLHRIEAGLHGVDAREAERAVEGVERSADELVGALPGQDASPVNRS